MKVHEYIASVAVSEAAVTEQIPFEVWRFFGRKPAFFGNQIEIAKEGDWATIPELQVALGWWVEQLGGKVKWK